jgi:hypothetical protein
MMEKIEKGRLHLATAFPRHLKLAITTCHHPKKLEKCSIFLTSPVKGNALAELSSKNNVIEDIDNAHNTFDLRRSILASIKVRQQSRHTKKWDEP